MLQVIIFKDPNIFGIFEAHKRVASIPSCSLITIIIAACDCGYNLYNYIQCAANISVLFSRVDELADPLNGFSLDHREKQLSAGTCECSG